ncbi:MAG TPA: AzlD domain-containing protein [Burkholderiales bacterium]|nr:AzlD domain-containing protein [Burkholderiales bacterium]
MSLWLAIVGMGLVTLALRASFLLLPDKVQLPALLRRALPFVPAAVLTALWAPELLLHKGVLYLSLHNERLLAGAAAVLVAWRWRLTVATIAVGLVALHLFDWLL